MKVFFYSKNDQQFGPLSLEELRYENISRDTLIWHRGLQEWKAADQVEELAELMEYIPPSHPSVERNTVPLVLIALNIAGVITSLLIWMDIRTVLFTGPIISILSLFGLYLFREKSNSDKLIVLIPLMVSVVGFFMLLLGNYNPNEALLPMFTIAIFGSLLFLLFSFDKIVKGP